MAVPTSFKRLLVLSLLMSYSLDGSTQGISDANINQTELWGDLTLYKKLNETWSVGGDLGLRTTSNGFKIWQFYFRPAVNYILTDKISFAAGVGSFNTINSSAVNTYEFRVFQDVRINWPKLSIFNLVHRLRFEERFFSFSNDNIDSDFRVRGRYLIGLRTDGFSLGGAQNWSVFGSLEPFFSLSENLNEFVANNFRWDSALSYQINQNLRLELHYIHQTSEIFSNNNRRVVENIFRIRVFKHF